MNTSDRPPMTFPVGLQSGQPPAGVRRRVAIRKQSYRFTDYLFWLMMLLISVPDVLELWGIDTIFKPYRVVSLALACLAFPVAMRESWRTRQFSGPLFVALLYAFAVTLLFGGGHAYDQMPFLISCLALLFATYGATSRKSVLIGLYGSLVSFLVTAVCGAVGLGNTGARVSGLFHNPNSLGYAGCFTLLLAMNRYFPMPNILRFVFGVGTLVITVFTGSRGSLLAMFGAVVSQLWRNKRLFAPLVGLSVALGAVFVIWGSDVSGEIGNQYAISRFSPTKIQEGGVGRLAIAKAALTVGWEHGFVGIGIGQYRLQYHTRFFHQYDRNGKILKLGTHNFYATLLTEWGLVGFVCFAMIFVRLIRASEHLRFEQDWIYGFCGCTLLMGVSSGILDDVLFWVMLGVCVQLIRFAPMPIRRPVPSNVAPARH